MKKSKSIEFLTACGKMTCTFEEPVTLEEGGKAIALLGRTLWKAHYVELPAYDNDGWLLRVRRWLRLA